MVEITPRVLSFCHSQFTPPHAWASAVAVVLFWQQFESPGIDFQLPALPSALLSLPLLMCMTPKEQQGSHMKGMGNNSNVE
jgi:hypothetical protein